MEVLKYALLVAVDIHPWTDSDKARSVVMLLDKLVEAVRAECAEQTAEASKKGGNPEW